MLLGAARHLAETRNFDGTVQFIFQRAEEAEGGGRVAATGRSSHGAMPHQGIDPILAGAHLVTALQSIAARSVAPLDAAVVSVPQFHGGEAGNVIPDFDRPPRRNAQLQVGGP